MKNWRLTVACMFAANCRIEIIRGRNRLGP